MDKRLVKKGGIYYTSWGYDQTNIDFVIVEKVSPTGKTVLCRRMSQKVVKSVPGADYVVPVSPYGKIFRLRVRNGGKWLVGSYPFTRGGVERRGYFLRWEGKPIYQTPSGLGH
jgi:hypothetical protein